MDAPPVFLRQSNRLLLIAAMFGAAAQSAAETSAPAEGQGDRPLAPVLRMVEASYARLESDVRDYTCRIVRRERIDGKLRPLDFINLKVRRSSPATTDTPATPFSVYLRFTSPAAMAGREVLYVEGRNDGKMLIRRGGKRLAYVTTYLDPESSVAMQDNRHPVTDIGFGRLLGKVASDVREDFNKPEVKVQFFNNAKINKRPCTRVAIIHPDPDAGFSYHRTELFIDKELNLPMAFANYGWPKQPGGKPPLVEQYVYDNVKLNVGLTDTDFDRANPKYGFLKSKP